MHKRWKHLQIRVLCLWVLKHLCATSTRDNFPDGDSTRISEFHLGQDAICWEYVSMCFCLALFYLENLALTQPHAPQSICYRVWGFCFGLNSLWWLVLEWYSPWRMVSAVRKCSASSPCKWVLDLLSLKEDTLLSKMSPNGISYWFKSLLLIVGILPTLCLHVSIF